MATRLDRFVEKSYELQRQCAVSNACGFVSGLLYYFLKAVGEPVELEYGLKEVYGEFIEHVWIRQGDRNIDPIYCEDLSTEKQKEINADVRYVSNPSPVALMMMAGITQSVTPICWYAQAENYKKLAHLAVKKPELLDFRNAVQKMTHDIYGTCVELPPNDECWGCQRKVPLKSCSRCLVAKYCGQLCQRQEWYMHKGMCIKGSFPRRPPANALY